MIKLRLSLDISVTKVIRGVAGITATVCAYLYFKSKKKNQVTYLKTEDKFCDDKENGKIPQSKNNLLVLSSSKSDVISKPYHVKSIDGKFKNNEQENDTNIDTNTGININTTVMNGNVSSKSQITDTNPIVKKSNSTIDLVNKCNILDENQHQTKHESVKTVEEDINIGDSAPNSNNAVKTTEEINVDDSKTAVEKKLEETKLSEKIVNQQACLEDMLSYVIDEKQTLKECLRNL